MTIHNVIHMQAIHPDDRIYLLMQGCFYRAYNEGACSLHSILGYKIRDADGFRFAGFPITAIDKVIVSVGNFYKGKIISIKQCNTYLIIQLENL